MKKLFLGLIFISLGHLSVIHAFNCNDIAQLEKNASKHYEADGQLRDVTYNDIKNMAQTRKKLFKDLLWYCEEDILSNAVKITLAKLDIKNIKKEKKISPNGEPYIFDWKNDKLDDLICEANAIVDQLEKNYENEAMI